MMACQPPKPKHCIAHVFTPNDGELVDTYSPPLALDFPNIVAEAVKNKFVKLYGKNGLTPSTVFFFKNFLEINLRNSAWLDLDTISIALGTTIGMARVHIVNLINNDLVLAKHSPSGLVLFAPSYVGIEKLTGYQIILKENFNETKGN